jgi:hypothetical protein
MTRAAFVAYTSLRMAKPRKEPRKEPLIESLSESEWAGYHCLATKLGGRATASELVSLLALPPYNWPIELDYARVILSRLEDKGWATAWYPEPMGRGRRTGTYTAEVPLLPAARDEAIRTVDRIAYGDPEILRVFIDVASEKLGEA